MNMTIHTIKFIRIMYAACKEVETISTSEAFKRQRTAENYRWPDRRRRRFSISFSTESLMSATACPICPEDLSHQAIPKRVPKFLTCGHTYCSNCIKAIPQSEYLCPECRKPTWYLSCKRNELEHK